MWDLNRGASHAGARPEAISNGLELARASAKRDSPPEPQMRR
jgi:hypothetical protein